ncbi:MAG: rRNA maturation RNase YbeY [Candidatus Paceibacterota bacterium]
MGISIANTTEEAIPNVNYKAIKEAALGLAYELNVVISTPEDIKKLNLIYRNKNEATDILSFPLSSDIGEMYMCPEEARKEAKKFDREYENFFAFLFIHGCAHLKGYDHSDTMEVFEAKLRKKFRI